MTASQMTARSRFMPQSLLPRAGLVTSVTHSSSVRTEVHAPGIVAGRGPR